ncbi:7,8-dihydro-6-hydroxymethylpterin dimethyltransferase [uncultured archaeon]|nr:7,8-dihydro-6-hydroxymethylpterin dimethyltransferase [uncultured archaeon]
MKNDSIISCGCLHPDHEEAIRYFEEEKVYSVQIESNLTCSQGCLYCYASASDAPMKELPGKNIIEVLDSAAKMDVKAIDWLGGDPLMRSDWYELMKYARDSGLTNNIWTSGMPLENNDVARKAVEISEGGFISVHLDSLDEGIYGKLHTGDPGKKIASILKGLDNIRALGKDNIINCITFTKLVGGGDVDKTINYFFREWGIRTCLTQMCVAGLAEGHQEWIPGVREIKKACSTRDEVNYHDSTFSMGSMDTNKFYCGGMICVTVDGDVTPCSVIRKGFGNILVSSLEQIVEQYKNELLFTHIRDPGNMQGHCGSCEHNPVCWGCRATAYYECGDMLAPDPKCWMNSQNILTTNKNEHGRTPAV